MKLLLVRAKNCLTSTKLVRQYWWMRGSSEMGFSWKWHILGQEEDNNNLMALIFFFFVAIFWENWKDAQNSNSESMLKIILIVNVKSKWRRSTAVKPDDFFCVDFIFNTFWFRKGTLSRDEHWRHLTCIMALNFQDRKRVRCCNGKF